MKAKEKKKNGPFRYFKTPLLRKDKKIKLKPAGKQI